MFIIRGLTKIPGILEQVLDLSVDLSAASAAEEWVKTTCGACTIVLCSKYVELLKLLVVILIPWRTI